MLSALLTRLTVGHGETEKAHSTSVHACKIETGEQNVRLTERQLVYEPRTWFTHRRGERGAGEKYFPQNFAAAADANLTKGSWQTGAGGREVCLVKNF